MTVNPKLSAHVHTRASVTRRFAGALLLVSGITHVAQLAVYPPKGDVVGAAVGGVIYFLIGWLLYFKESRLPVWAAAILPTVGGLGAVHRYLHIHSNPFILFHILVDIIVVPSCVYLLIRARTEPADV